MKSGIIYFIIGFAIFSAVGIITSVNILVYQTSKPFIYGIGDSIPHAKTAILLGASVFPDGTLSPILKDRADRAIDLYQSQDINTILVSGDNGTMNYNEVDPINKYLLDHGIPKESIFLDYEGFDTYSTMYRARDVFKVKRVLIVSQMFHLPRAVFIARRLGLEAYGIKANDKNVLFGNYVREVLANEKAVFALMLRLKPKSLGPPTPIAAVSW